ncbi:hypothetical protein [Candidatus Ichthyocystis hellenicum]|uniref:hypothetical protein n=1 Tax=Candidatus Ichthyocystis hellenicum TaxID=1561003 RepID=UPI0011122504|nr:hypothetical protein [Candidatus Ichthyocystis hellenicum]
MMNNLNGLCRHGPQSVALSVRGRLGGFSLSVRGSFLCSENDSLEFDFMIPRYSASAMRFAGRSMLVTIEEEAEEVREEGLSFSGVTWYQSSSRAFSDGYSESHPPTYDDRESCSPPPSYGDHEYSPPLPPYRDCDLYPPPSYECLDLDLPIRSFPRRDAVVWLTASRRVMMASILCDYVRQSGDSRLRSSRGGLLQRRCVSGGRRLGDTSANNFPDVDLFELYELLRH